ncbi:MAG: alanine racemase [Parcubacteria group bacterium]|nr:MAG: alanine racemase [Parcubacteria group bacterium]
MPLAWVEINKANLVHNLQQYKNIIPHAQIWPVIKSNAYGHGLASVLSILEKEKNAAGFMLANLDEALAVRVLSKKPLMVLSYFDPEESQLLKIVDQNISLTVYDLATADYLNDLGAKLNTKFQINIKVDTGTSRLGFRVEEAADVVRQIQHKPNLEIFSIFSHFAESEAEDQTFSRGQLAQLNQIKKQFPDILFHIACSAAAISVPDSQLDIVRLGLSLYGLWPSEPSRQRGEKLGLDLHTVLSWCTKIVQIKKIKSGESIGYNRTHIFEHDGQLAVLPVGYNEGYPRALSNKSEVLIKGKRCPVRGNICMNLTMVEIPQGLEVKVGDRATLIGIDDAEKISAEYLAGQAQSINYEIVTRINTDIPRIII